MNISLTLSSHTLLLSAKFWQESPLENSRCIAVTRNAALMLRSSDYITVLALRKADTLSRGLTNTHEDLDPSSAIDIPLPAKG
jgi:hypothetical protein